MFVDELQPTFCALVQFAALQLQKTAVLTTVNLQAGTNVIYMEADVAWSCLSREGSICTQTAGMLNVLQLCGYPSVARTERLLAPFGGCMNFEQFASMYNSPSTEEEKRLIGFLRLRLSEASRHVQITL